VRRLRSSPASAPQNEAPHETGLQGGGGGDSSRSTRRLRADEIVLAPRFSGQPNVKSFGRVPRWTASEASRGDVRGVQVLRDDRYVACNLDRAVDPLA
jgi:hypothetical protein